MKSITAVIESDLEEGINESRVVFFLAYLVQEMTLKHEKEYIVICCMFNTFL